MKASGPVTDNLRGIGWALLATALFTLAAAMAKVAVNDYHVLQILFFRQLMVFCSSLPAISRSFPQSLHTTQPYWHLLRLCGAFTALSCGIWAVAVLPLTTAITLGFAQVFLVAVLARLFLGEAVGYHRMGAVLVGFIGVVIVMRPGADGLINLHALIPVAGALGAAAAIISVRRLSQTESTATLLVYQALFVGLLAGIPLLWFWVSPTLSDTAFLLGMGAIAAMGQWSGVKALRLGEASVIGNVEYIKLVYATLLGFVVFAELPDQYTIIGAAVIIGSSAFLFRRESRQQRRNIR
ncbi:MAG: DMT family transporter [Burkholderiaceae bacterium]